MAITLKTDYRKTLGLPGYSSHSFSASVEVEISNIADAPREIQELYTALQQNVDLQIQDPGFIPPDTYGCMGASKASDSVSKQLPNNVTQLPTKTTWNCSDKQQELILKLIDEKSLPKNDVEQIANEMFSKGVIALNKLEASGLIERLFNIPSTAKKAYRKGGQR